MTGDQAPAAEQLLRVDLRRAGSAMVVTVAGEVDMFTAPRLEAAVGRSLADATVNVTVVDLTRVAFLDDAGLSALVTAHRAAERQDEPLRIVVDHNRPVVRPLQITGLERVLALYYDVAEALREPHSSGG
ncbi:STAS domain-containing protein [Pseudonocardia kujensis]|uniref:STAS domain-containing protein n=1 Tax=Pseudonocardia kujensis TaxID=1128675 RepID=UPI001E593FA1|nr:STAS domain-containing protein [Pseudonocardia kujensis]MCE0763783.1 STAS domain-containing protein [Pseudonocardia kujensis]